jgi:Rhomboid-like protein
MSEVPGERPRRPPNALRRYAVAWAYLGCFVLVAVIYALLDPRAQASFVSWASTSAVNLEHDPVGCLLVSAFVTGGTAWGVVTWLPVIAIAMFGAVGAVGNRRTVVVCAAGQIVGTLVSEGIVAWLVSTGALPVTYRHLVDVGPSYVVVSAAVVALLCGTRQWRVLAALDLALLVFVARIFAGLTHLDVSAVGHLTAIITAAACVPLLRRTGRGKRPNLWIRSRGRLRRGRSGT